MNAQGTLLFNKAAQTADTDETVLTAKGLALELTRVLFVNSHDSQMANVELRHVPKGETSAVQHRIYMGSVNGNKVEQVLEAKAEGQGITLSPGDTLVFRCTRTDTYVKAYGVPQSTKQLHREQG